MSGRYWNEYLNISLNFHETSGFIYLSWQTRVGIWKNDGLGFWYCIPKNLTLVQQFEPPMTEGRSDNVWPRKTITILTNYCSHSVSAFTSSTHGCKSLTILLVKRDNDLLDWQSAQHSSMWLYPCSAQDYVYQASHCSALLIGWLNFCTRVCIYVYR